MISWKGREVRYSTSAYHEMSRYNLGQHDILGVLELGMETVAKRTTGVVEKCLQKKQGLLKVVVAESFDYSSKQVVWTVIHVAIIKSSKGSEMK